MIGSSALRRAATGVGSTSGLFALWALMAGKTAPAELVVGAIAAVIAAWLARWAGLLGRVAVRPRARWVVRLWRVPWWVLRDSMLVLGALVRRAPRQAELVSLRFPAGDSPARAMARRALAESAGSLGPNCYVVGIDDELATIVVSRLVARGGFAPLEVVREP